MSMIFILLVSLFLIVSGTPEKSSDDGHVNNHYKVKFDSKSSDEVHKRDIITRQKRADDVDLAALQTVIQQQAATIQQLQSQQTTTQNEIAATRGEITALKNSLPATFSPVAFTVRFSKDNVADGVDMSTHSILQFDHVITNQGNGYSPQTGIFTAPYAGVYCFFINFMSVNGHGHTYVAIDKHGSAINYAFADGGDANDQGASQATVHLNAGEQLWARQHGGNAIRGGSYTVFTGYLVQAD